MKKIVATLLAVLWLTVVPVAVGSTYQERLERGRALTEQINQWRSPDLRFRYLLAKVADQRATARAAEYARTGTLAFPHDLGPVVRALNAAGWCWRSVGETTGVKNRIDSRLTTRQIADLLTDRWYASPNHRPLLSAKAFLWGGGSWAKGPLGSYFYAYYVVDPC